MGTLKLAIQKSGRLFDNSQNLIQSSGIEIISKNVALKTKAKNYPLEIYYLRNSDIPKYINNGVVDIGIVGQNLLFERNNDLEVIQKLGFSKCRLSLAVPQNIKYESLQFFDGKKIATSYPNSLKKFLDLHKINAKIHQISGSVEISPGIGLADGVCDLVSTGFTLSQNRLKEVEIIMNSEAVIARSSNIKPEIQSIIDDFVFRTSAVLKAKNKKYILFNVKNDHLDKIISILPGLESPSIQPLAKQHWNSVQAVIDESRFWEILTKIKKYGAKDILVMPIEKIIP